MGMDMNMTKRLNKIFTYRNEKYKRLIDGILENEYNYLGKTFSANFEDTFLDSKLPKDIIARSIAEGLYLDPDYWKINNSLATIFGNLCSMAVWTDSYDNVPLLLQYMMDLECERQHSFNTKNELIYHLISQLDSVVSILEEQHRLDINSVSHNTIDYLRCVKSDLESNYQYVSIFTLLSVIKENWSFLKMSTRTYRLLHDICVIRSEWSTNSKSVVEFVFDYDKKENLK